MGAKPVHFENVDALLLTGRLLVHFQEQSRQLQNDFLVSWVQLQLIGRVIGSEIQLLNRHRGLFSEVDSGGSDAHSETVLQQLLHCSVFRQQSARAYPRQWWRGWRVFWPALAFAPAIRYRRSYGYRVSVGLNVHYCATYIHRCALDTHGYMNYTCILVGCSRWVMSLTCVCKAFASYRRHPKNVKKRRCSVTEAVFLCFFL